MNKLILGFLAWVLIALPVLAADPRLRADHPDEYVVKQGDTLWDISGRFLEQPWLWPEIWHANSQIKNPHLIYPGDRLNLVYIDGRARLSLTRGGGAVRLSPGIRSTALTSAIPAIPLEDINAFLSHSRFVEPGELETAPYVLAGEDGRVVAGAGDKLYARGNLPADEHSFGIFRAGNVYIDPQTQEVLGQAALEIGAGKVIDSKGDIATLAVNVSSQEILGADRLLPAIEQKITATFFPSAPEADISGHILAVEGGVTQVGKLNIVVIDRGLREGLKEGNVLAIHAAGKMVRDPITKQPVMLPDSSEGLLMVFRSYDKLSLGLVLHATKPLKVMDVVKSP
jgi:LysM domain